MGADLRPTDNGHAWHFGQVAISGHTLLGIFTTSRNLANPIANSRQITTKALDDDMMFLNVQKPIPDLSACYRHVSQFCVSNWALGIWNVHEVKPMLLPGESGQQGQGCRVNLHSICQCNLRMYIL